MAHFTVPQIDHIVYATLNLEQSIDHLESFLGVQATPGGHHPNWGTRNALISLGDRVYLEIVGPDSLRAQAKLPALFGLDKLKVPRLVTWAAQTTHLEKIVLSAKEHRADLGRVSSASRQRPDGSILAWTMTDPFMSRLDGLVPFFIDWGESIHPAQTAIKGCTLIQLRAEHPRAQQLHKIITELKLDLSVSESTEPALIATLKTPHGMRELR